MPTKQKTQQPKANATKKVVKRKNTLKNKNIVDTKVKNIVPMVKKKVNQKIKNVKNSTPKQLVKKVAKNTQRIVNNLPTVKLAKKVARTVVKSFRDSKPLSKSPKPKMRSNFGPKY
jgi:vacuolar-type H+-ATPase subunit E/Vma4